VAIVNESIARRYFPGQNRSGGGSHMLGFDIEIVGVVRDAHTQRCTSRPLRGLLSDRQRPAAQHTITNLDVRVAGDPARPSPRCAIRRRRGCC
jgi:hypothetical protein